MHNSDTDSDSHRVPQCPEHRHSITASDSVSLPVSQCQLHLLSRFTVFSLIYGNYVGYLLWNLLVGHIHDIQYYWFADQ